MTSDPGEEADLLDRAGVEATAAAHYAAAEELLRRALERRRAAGDGRATAWTLTLLARAILPARTPERVLELLEPAVEELADLAPDPAFVALEAQLGRALFLGDQHRRALEVLERVLEAAEHADLRDVLADALVTRGSALCAIGRLQEGLGVIEIGERLARANGLGFTVMRAINNRAGVLFDFDLPATIELCREGVAVARRVGDRSSLFSLGALLGFGLWISGDLDGALASFEAGLADEPEPADRLVLLDGAIIVRAARGEPVGEQLAELERLAVGMSDWNVIWTTVDAPAWVAFCEGRLEEAGRRWREGAMRNPIQSTGWLQQAAGASLLLGDAGTAAADLATLDASGFHTPFLELQRRRIRAGLAALEGRTPEAARTYRDVLREMLARGYAWDHAIVCIEMVTLVSPSEPETVAESAVARATLERARATPFLERLDARPGAARPATRSDPGSRRRRMRERRLPRHRMHARRMPRPTPRSRRRRREDPAASARGRRWSQAGRSRAPRRFSDGPPAVPSPLTSHRSAWWSARTAGRRTDRGASSAGAARPRWRCCARRVAPRTSRTCASAANVRRRSQPGPPPPRRADRGVAGPAEPGHGARRGASARHGPLRRPCGLHDARGGPGRGGHPGAPLPLLRPVPRRHRPLRRDRREVHRRRGHGGLGCADRPRGRRRAGRPRRPGPRRAPSGRWVPRSRRAPGS